MNRSSRITLIMAACGVLAIAAGPARAAWLPDGNPVCRVPETQGQPVGTMSDVCFPACGATLSLFWQDGRNHFASIYRGALSDFGPPPDSPGDVPATLVRQAAGFAFPAGVVSVPPLQAGSQFAGPAKILVWTEGPASGPGHIRAQRLDDLTDWGPDGVNVSGDTPGHSSVSVVSDDSGGVIVAWRSTTSLTSRDYIQRIDALGQIRWGAEGVFIGPDTTVHLVPHIASDGSGSVYVLRAARDSVSGVYVNALFRFGRDGVPVAGWPVGGVRPIGVSGELRADATGCWIVGDGSNTLSDGSVASMTRVTRLLPDGSAAPGWSVAGAPVVGGLQGEVRLEDVALAGSGDLLVLMRYIRWLPTYSPTLLDLIAQRVPKVGGTSPGWPANGAVVCDAPENQWQSRIFAQGDGLFCAWSDQRSDNGDIYALRLTANGTRPAEWPENGLRVCGATGMQSQPVIGPSAVGGGLVAWLDQRDFATHQTDLYGHTVSADARLDAEHRAPYRFALSAARPNPARGPVRMRLDLPLQSNVRLDVLDVAGRLVHGHSFAAAAGFLDVGWDLHTDTGSRARPGLYLMRVSAGGFERSARVVVVE
jgi:hypothetical protein